MHKKICLIAIVKDENPFLDEWIIYHRLLGIDHFYIYDDDPSFLLSIFLEPHKEYVTIINWHGKDKSLSGRMNQTKAYTHAYENYTENYEWVTFIDADEFIVLHYNQNIKDFLDLFHGFVAISLNWHVFGHNGYYENPEGLITASLNRRMYNPSRQIKSITRADAIYAIESPHLCRLKYGLHVDGNRKQYKESLYPGRTEAAHINHYQSRSFRNWMNRVTRGDVNFNKSYVTKENEWRLTEEDCLKQFVTTVAKDKNEYIDQYMLKYKDILEEKIQLIKR